LMLAIWDDTNGAPDAPGDPGDKWMVGLRPKDETAKKIALEDLVMVVEFSLEETP